MTSVDDNANVEATESPQLSLSTAAARNLATTTKTVPQMQGISSRWLLRLLPWVQTNGGTFRVNRRLSYAVGTGRVQFSNVGDRVQVIPPTLSELPLLRGFDDEPTLEAIAGVLEQRDFEAGQVIVSVGDTIDTGFLMAHGKASKIGTGKYGDDTKLGMLADGDYFGEDILRPEPGRWPYTVKAVTPCTLLVMRRDALRGLVDNSEPLNEHINRLLALPDLPRNDDDEAAIDLAAGHDGEPDLPGTFVDYELSPREYELNVAQTVLRVHSRVADLYNDPMNQVEQQLRLTVEALRERQENEIVNNPSFGLLDNADLKQRISTDTGPPTPDDMDDLLSIVWKEPGFFLAHPRTIAAFGQECSRRGIYPDAVEVAGHRLPGWRGVPIYPCNKIPVTEGDVSSILLMRTGQENQGVVGLHQIGLPDEYEPGLSVRFMGINEKGIISYLVSTYYSAAVLVPDALGVLENVQIGRPAD
ncbi:family 2B encapsulin nanocompartment shell protein [Stackebrandtia nassauensis]|uniref:Putative transcriptional regulator, Crp/Fnr family n=1 Tax=Stackebrandtia nassauensis (strain DSM 44728 / CIP 108903 / NRRL B-16338 / NBRC 102104 / LLR-40K-21) TaxID=446470 RepID=D3PZL4_STANL|nr:family 2B encapsulin nanocompartment shell protein [Stackebrandtia nassauensis]ADD41688.1 putative transcriptional regulator, Crp/Fnr family [Stackebrandtia nassauensis DSM 44728]